MILLVVVAAFVVETVVVVVVMMGDEVATLLALFACCLIIISGTGVVVGAIVVGLGGLSLISVVLTFNWPSSVWVVVVDVGGNLPSVSQTQSKQHSSTFDRCRVQPSPGASL